MRGNMPRPRRASDEEAWLVGSKGKPSLVTALSGALFGSQESPLVLNRRQFGHCLGWPLDVGLVCGACDIASKGGHVVEIGN